MGTSFSVCEVWSTSNIGEVSGMLKIAEAVLTLVFPPQLLLELCQEASEEALLCLLLTMKSSSLLYSKLGVATHFLFLLCFLGDVYGGPPSRW